MTPKVSVIVPCYNAEKTINQCLDSLVNQTLKDIEIICINDGSTDKTLSILEAYENCYSNVHVYSQEDLGQANAMNRGLFLSKGEYIAECDSDDFVSLNCYEVLYNATEGKADVVRCGWFGNYENGFLEPNKITPYAEFYNKPICPRELPDKLKMGVFGRLSFIPAGIYKRSFILENELLWREKHNFEDTVLSLKIRATANDYRYINAILYYYRRGNEGSGTLTIKDDLAIFEQYEEARKFIKEKGIDIEDVINTDAYSKYTWALSRATDKEAFIERMQASFNRHEAKEYMMSELQWLRYSLIKSGAWKDIIKKHDISWFYTN